MRSFVEAIKGIARFDAPTREIKINFGLPASLSHEAPPELERLQIPKRDTALANSAAYLNTCRKEARQLSRSNMAVARRMQLTEDFIPYFLPVATTHILTYTKGGGIPDDDLRQELLELTVEIIKLLIDSYKIVFKKLYTGSGLAYVNSVKHAQLSAFRILELTKLQQRVMGLRYELLPASAWLVVNTVFHAMRDVGQADTPITPLDTHEADGTEAPKSQTITEMFLSVQLIAKFDILRWPTEWQAFFYAYCRSVDWLAEVIPDQGGELPRHMAISYCQDARPARPVRFDGDAALGPSMLIDWSKLHRKIASDFLVFFNDNEKGELSYFQKKLARLSYNECLALVQLQFECVTDGSDQGALEMGGGTACDMRIFIGFRSVYQLLQHIQGGKHEVETRLADVLAKRSAVLAEDDVATVESVWYLQYQDDRLLRLKTQETQFTTSMKIGMMAAYGIGNEGIGKPQFGVISKIFRPSARTVVVDILKYGEYVEPVVVTTDLEAFEIEGRKIGSLLGAIVVRDAGGESKLLLPPVSTLREKTQLAMKRSRGPERLALGKKQSVTRDFFLFRVAFSGN